MKGMNGIANAHIVWRAYGSKPLCNECSLTMTSGYFLSTVAQNGHYQAQLVLSNFEKQVKATEFSVVSRSYVWFG